MARSEIERTYPANFAADRTPNPDNPLSRVSPDEQEDFGHRPARAKGSHE